MTVAVPPAKPLHLLLIAPAAPPKSGPEAMQVGRFLAALDPAVQVTLVTSPVVQGWEAEDKSLAIQRPGMRVIAPALPAHRLTQRILGNHRLAALHMPDSDFWLPWYAKQVIKQLDGTPDVIYSRSAPFSSALLARRLKAILRRPWMMHLSDPWAGSPYRPMPAGRAAKDRELEQACFADADLVALTTEGQADFYRDRYPQLAQRIIVSPNMMGSKEAGLSLVLPVVQSSKAKAELLLVHTGALYGDRNPSGLLQALEVLMARHPSIAQRIKVHFIGNMPPQIARLIESNPLCTTRPPVSFLVASKIQREADILLSIEPQSVAPIYKHFLLSKVVDYLSAGRPLLALTPADSLTSSYCNKGYGWAFSPNDVAAIASFLEGLLLDAAYLRNWVLPPPPLELAAASITFEIEQNLRRLASKNGLEGHHA
jgi:hypothetical protein